MLPSFKVKGLRSLLQIVITLQLLIPSFLNKIYYKSIIKHLRLSRKERPDQHEREISRSRTLVSGQWSLLYLRNVDCHNHIFFALFAELARGMHSQVKLASSSEKVV